MNLAVITAFSPGYRRVAQLATPSHKCLAARLRAAYFELPLPDDGQHNWRKVELILDYLASWHSVLWLDADCIVPHKWELPTPINGQRFFFPMTKVLGELHYWHFAGYYINCTEATLLLARMSALRPDLCHDGLADERALNNALGEQPTWRALAGPMPRGLIHYHGIPHWEKAQKLRAETLA